jgi:hypothetical protein
MTRTAGGLGDVAAAQGRDQIVHRAGAHAVDVGLMGRQQGLLDPPPRLRAGLPAVIIVDNDGYTVERAIHGPDEPYNGIARWDWTRLPAVFAPGSAAPAHQASTVGELACALRQANRAPSGVTLIQAVLPRLDVPPLLSTLARAAARGNNQALEPRPGA